MAVSLMCPVRIALSIGLLAAVAHIACGGEDQLIDSGLVEFAYRAEADDGATIQPVAATRRAARQRLPDATCDGKFEIGLNGAEGNSRTMNLVIGLDAKRVRGPATTTIDIDYLYSKDEAETTKNRLLSTTRYEHEIPSCQGGWFLNNWFEHDMLEEFRTRIGLHSGVFATLLKDASCELKGSAGLGATKDFEGMNTDWKPELYLGAEWERRINDRQTVYVRSTFLPDFADFGSFLLRTKAGWDFSLNQAETWKLSLTIFDRYDSTPSGTDRKNNIDYWASLAYSF